MMDLFSSADWASVLIKAYGFEVHRSEEGDFPYVVLDDLAGRKVSMLPFSDYLPIRNPQTLEAIREELSRKFPTYPLTFKTLLAEHEIPNGYNISRKAVYHRYTKGEAESSFARGVRRALRDGIQVVRSTDGQALERFAEMYHWQRLRKFGGIPQPPTFFKAIHETFIEAGKGFYLEAYTKDGTPAASMVVLASGTGWFYKFGTSHPDYLNSRPNNLLFDHLTRAVDNGEASFLDLGLSGAGEAYAGLRRFKAGTGAEEFPIHYLTIPHSSEDRRAKDFRQLAGKLTKVIVAADLNREITEQFSEHLYRFFA